MPEGGLKVASLAMAYRPTKVASPTVVETDGAVADEVDVLVWPPDTSTGVTGSMPENATMPPIAVDTGPAKFHV